MTDPFEQAAQALRQAQYAIALTGAGISVESGIPSFRGAHGIWAKYDPEKYATLAAYLANPRDVWAFWQELHRTVKNCRPNPAHRALAQLEAAGRLRAVITQNVDNLHQEAGSRRVVEYHGNTRWLSCIACRRRELLDYDLHPAGPPRCRCGGLMKPDVVMFGEQIPPRALIEADQLAHRADVVIVVGTSAQVFPAAQLPFAAKATGAVIIEANIERTDFTRSVTDIFLEGPAAETLPRLAKHVMSSCGGMSKG